MRHKSIATLGLLALLAAGSAFGQQKLGAADIPFKFQIGKVVLPAGHYDVFLAAGSMNVGPLLLRCHDCKTAGVLVGTYHTYYFASSQRQMEGTLVFNVYGNRYFLSKIVGHDGENLVSKSRTEREIARNTPKSETGQVVLARR